MADLAVLAAPLVASLRDAEGLVLVVTGAGVSAASGIRTFRGKEPGALWREHDVAMATAGYFRRDPVGQLAWYLDRFAAVDAARPNPAHRSLAAIERHLRSAGRPFLLVTQNIDTLHEQAGSERLIKVHGTADRVRCGRERCPLGAPSGSLPRSAVDLDSFRREPGEASLPRCPECGSPLRPHVLFFDEYYADHHDYRFAEVEQAAGRAAAMLFVGTSFAVGVTALLLDAGTRRGVPMWSIDPAAGRAPGGAPVRALAAPAERLLPVVAAALGGPPAGGASGRRR